MDVQHFRKVLRDECAENLSEHEIITVARHYQDRQGENNNQATLVAIAQEQLRKCGFTDYNKVEQAITNADSTA